MAAVQIADIVVPEVFTSYIQQLTEEKSRIVQSGALGRNPAIDSFLSGGGLTFNIPSFQDLDASDATGIENVSTDQVADIQAASFENSTPTDANRGDATPQKIGTALEIGTRLSRNQNWSSMDLSKALAGPDPLAAIASRVAKYWARRLQKIYIAVWNGIIADNNLAPSGTDTHVQFDLTNDVSGASFIDGVTNFTAEAFQDTLLTMGDSMDDLGLMMVHSVVMNRMRKNNLIDFIPDARGETRIAVFQDHEVIVDDGMPVTANVYDTWVFAPNASQLGEGAPKVGTAVTRQELAGNGGGQEVLTNRREWSIHPTGHAFIATPASGGPNNTVLAAAASWSRVYSERKQIKFARLVTREA